MDTLRRFAAQAVISLLAISTAPAQPPAGARPLTLGVYWLAFHCDASTSKPLRWRAKASDNCLDRNPILDQRDVVSAEFDAAASQKWTLKLTLRETAAQHFAEITTHKIGGIIGTVVNGELVSVATIQAPVDHLWVSGLTEQEARSIIDAVQRGAVSTAPVLLPGPEHQPPDANGVYIMSPGISQPMLIHKQEPEYTESARAAGIQGSVSLEAVVKPDGTAEIIRLIRSLDPGLDQKAIECARKFRFRPATLGGKPVPLKVTLQINFHL